MTIEQLAEKAELDENNLTKIELGMHNPSLLTIVSLLNAFNTDTKGFFNNFGDKEKYFIIDNILNIIKHFSDEDKETFYKIVKTI